MCQGQVQDWKDMSLMDVCAVAWGIGFYLTVSSKWLNIGTLNIPQRHIAVIGSSDSAASRTRECCRVGHSVLATSKVYSIPSWAPHCKRCIDRLESFFERIIRMLKNLKIWGRTVNEVSLGSHNCWILIFEVLSGRRGNRLSFLWHHGPKQDQPKNFLTAI